MEVKVVGVHLVLGGGLQNADRLVQRLDRKPGAKQAMGNRVTASGADCHPIGMELVLTRQPQSGIAEHAEQLDNQLTNQPKRPANNERERSVQQRSAVVA